MTIETIASYTIPPLACLIIGIALGWSEGFSRGYQAGLQHGAEMSE